MRGLNIVPLTAGTFAGLRCWCMWWALPRDAFNCGRGDVNRRRYQRVEFSR
jgi:hypothetical protein